MRRRRGFFFFFVVVAEEEVEDRNYQQVRERGAAAAFPEGAQVLGVRRERG